MSESFEDAMAFARKVAYCSLHREQDSEVSEWCHIRYNGNCEECTLCLINHLQKAHDHEMEQLRRLRFSEGYEAGQRSMDAEHQAVALRLKHLPLDEDSHGNLSQIARAIWHSDFGWTRGACKSLRDELVRLLGGVHDEPAQVPASRCDCDADCDCCHGNETAVAYDELGNERHKAVCELRKMTIDSDYHGNYQRIALAIGTVYDGESFASECVRDRLIHLLGGDEPLPNLSEPNLPKSAEIAKPESDDGGEVTITDELRDYLGENGQEYDNFKGETIASISGGLSPIYVIADRIDEQEHKLRKQRDGFRRGMVAAQDLLEKRTGERDELQKELEDTRAALNRAAGRWAKARERERELQERLDEYERRDTAESIVRDIHLGKVTDSQAIERIRALP